MARHDASNGTRCAYDSETRGDRCPKPAHGTHTRVMRGTNAHGTHAHARASCAGRLVRRTTGAPRNPLRHTPRNGHTTRRGTGLPPFFRDCSVFGQGRLSHLRFCRAPCPKVLRSRKVGAGLPLPTATVAFSDKAVSATCGFAGPLVRKCYVRAALIHNCSVFGHDTFH